jgi:hypothetical protein
MILDVQQAVQLEVLRSIEHTGYVEYAAIDRDARDVDRAVELLMRDGVVVVDHSNDTAGPGLPLRLTDLGQARLRARG